MLVLQAGLGSVDRRVDFRGSPHTSNMLKNLHTAREASNASRSSFPVYRLDGLFASIWSDERLAFAHFDVEGSELDVLNGSETVIRRDRPVFTIEVAIKARAYHAALRRVADLGYRAFMVPETCGANSDCRNLICVPRERAPTSALLRGARECV